MLLFSVGAGAWGKAQSIRRATRRVMEEDLWLAELSRLLPELRVRYPDLPTPTEDELTAKGRLFEAVARLLDALCQRAPLVLLVDDLQWVDEASLDLLRYLGYFWKEHGSLVHALLDAGTFEEAFELTQHTMAFARTLPPTLLFQRFLTALERTYHAVQQWEEAHSTLAEADAVAEMLDLGRVRAPALSQLCMNYAVTGEWGQAHTYAVQAIAIRKSARALIMLDFSRQYETEALLRAREEHQAREELQQLGEHLGLTRRFRIPYLQSSAILAAWEGEREQAIDHLREAAQLAAEIGLPAEQWQIQAALGSVYETAGEQGQARTAFGEAATIIEGLAEGIKDEMLRSRFLAGPQIHPVLQHAQRLATSLPDDHTEPSGL